MVFSQLLRCRQSFVQMLSHRHLNRELLRPSRPQQQQNLNVQCRLEKQPLRLRQHQTDGFVSQPGCKSEISHLEQYVVPAQPAIPGYDVPLPSLCLYFSQLGEQIKPYEAQFGLNLHLRSELHHSFQFHAYSGCKHPRFA